MQFAEKVKKLRPLFAYSSRITSNSCLTRERKNQIDCANKFYLKRIKKQNSALNVVEWEKDFKKSRSFKKNICIYPSINFQKSLQQKIDKEKSENRKKYGNKIINCFNNLFKKTKFKNVKFYEPKEIKNDDNIDNEHFNKGENEKENEKLFKLFFIVDENEKKIITINDCKKSDNFLDIIDKVCKSGTGLNKDKIKMDEFTIKGRTDGKEYIDSNDTLEGNRLEGNEEIIIKMKKEE